MHAPLNTQVWDSEAPYAQQPSVNGKVVGYAPPDDQDVFKA